MVEFLLLHVVAPIIVGLVITLIDHWLDQDNDLDAVSTHADYRSQCKKRANSFVVSWLFVLMVLRNFTTARKNSIPLLSNINFIVFNNIT